MRRVTRSLALLLAFALLVSVFALGGCAKKEEPAAEEPAAKPTYTLVSEGKITVGSDTSFPPFESMNGTKVEGFDVDLMNAIGKELGLEVEFKTETFDTLVPTLKAGGKFDVIASAMFITDVRLESIDFSEPYGVANQAIVVKTDSAIKTEADLAGKKISVQSGTVGSDWVKENVKDATVVEPKTAPDQIVAVQAGNVDAAVNDAPVMRYFAMDASKGIRVLKEVPAPDKYGFGVSKDNPELLKAINDALAKLKASGEYATIYKKWFGTEPPAE